MNTPWPCRLRAAAIAVALLAPLAGADAQEFRATINGRVTDPQGATVPGAAVTVTNTETNASVATVTNDSGSYTVAQLQPGGYTVTVELAGFHRFVREGLTLRTAERVTVNVQLQLGSVSETLTVAGGVSSTDSNESTLAQTMENRRVAELPLNGRQVYMLLQLTAGTFFTQTTFGSTGFSGTRAWDTNGSIQIHGSRTGNNEFLIDGAPNSATGGWQYAPPVDAIEEFKVQSASVDASYGRTSGGVVNMALKAGTNQLRGSTFLFYRGNALDANTTQNNRNGIKNTDHRFVDGGAVVSGPIRSDKTFFMAGYQGFHENIPFPRTSTVPTALERAGDFSQTRNSQGQLITIFDPLTTRPDPTRPGRFVRDPFSGNRVPADRVNPVALQLLGFIPSSNVAGDPFTATNNLAVSPNLGLYRYNSYLSRIDHHFSPRHRLFFTSTGNWGVEFRNQNGFPMPALRGNWPKHRNHYMETLDDVFTINTTTLLNVRASFDRFNDYNPITYASMKTPLGIKTPFQVVDPQYPYVTIDGYQDFFPGTYGQSVNNIYSLQGNVSKTWGEHFLKMGGDFRSYRLNRVGLGDGNGRFDFNRGFTQRDPQSGDATSGNAMASFLLGFPSGGGIDVNATSARQYLYTAVFIQDDWKVNPRLTVNLGLRWDFQAPPTERYDRLSVGFDQSAVNPFKVPGLSLRGGLRFAGRDGQPRAPYDPDLNDIQPRIGLSYKISDKILFRTNYGRSYLPLTGAGEEGINQTGFSRRTGLISFIQTGIPFNTLDRPYPEGILKAADGSEGLATNVGSGFSVLNRGFETPYADQWSAGFNIDLPWHVSVDAAYVGTRTRKLPINGRSINEVPRAEREKAIERLGGNASYLSTQVPNPFVGLIPGTALNNATTSRGQLLRPFPQFTGITLDRVNEGSAQYDALELVVNRRFSKGLVAVANYTLSKQFEEGVTSAGATGNSVTGGYLNNGYDDRPWRALSSTDRTHRLALSALYMLPFGRGQRFGSNASGVKDWLISGWQVNAVGELQTGTPTSMPGGILLDPKGVKLPKDQQTFDRWFDNSTVSNPRPDGTYAWTTIPPNDFRTLNVRFPDIRDPAGPQWAFSLFKNMRFGQQLTAQFRLETFNAFNTPLYGGPDTGINSSRFGRVTANQNNFPRHVQLGLRVLF